jgi:hypothetical protein
MALVLAFLATRGPGSVERRRLAYRHAGIPVSVEELERSVPEMREADNEAFKLRTAMRSWRRLNGFHELEFQAVDSMLKATPGMGTNLQKELTANHASLELLHSITNPLQSRIGVTPNVEPGDGDLFYQFQKAVLESSGVLLLECRAHRSRDDPEGAAEALVSGLRVARMLERTRSMQAHWDHLTMLDGWLRELEFLLAGGPLPPASLELLQRELDLHDELLGLPLVVQALRVSTFESFRRLWIDSAGANAGLGYQPGPMERMLIQLYAGSGIPSRDLLRSLDLMDQFLPLAEKTTEAFQAAEPRVVRPVGAAGVLRMTVGHGEIVTSGILHDLWNRRLELVSRLRCGRTAVAVERWRGLHGGELPKGLQLLVPRLMPAVPVQPSGGAPLRYAPRSSGYAIESAYGDSAQAPVVFTVQFPSPNSERPARP